MFCNYHSTGGTASRQVWSDTTFEHNSGPACRELIEQLLYRHRYPQQGFRSALGILRLGKTHGSGRLEAACARALIIGSITYRSVDSILKRGLEQPSEPPQEELTLDHTNVRGAAYYH